MTEIHIHCDLYNDFRPIHDGLGSPMYLLFGVPLIPLAAFCWDTTHVLIQDTGAKVVDHGAKSRHCTTPR